MFPPEPSSSVSRVIGATLITHDSALPKPTAKGDRAASKRNGILSTELAPKENCICTQSIRSGTFRFKWVTGGNCQGAFLFQTINDHHVGILPASGGGTQWHEKKLKRATIRQTCATQPSEA
jgi:hypothetical protein